MNFSGRIDRIDKSKDDKKIMLIDYKTHSMPKSVAAKIKKGELFQPSIYYLKCKEYFKNDDIIWSYAVVDNSNDSNKSAKFQSKKIKDAIEDNIKHLDKILVSILDLNYSIIQNVQKTVDSVITDSYVDI